MICQILAAIGLVTVFFLLGALVYISLQYVKGGETWR